MTLQRQPVHAAKGWVMLVRKSRQTSSYRQPIHGHIIYWYSPAAGVVPYGLTAVFAISRLPLQKPSVQVFRPRRLSPSAPLTSAPSVVSHGQGDPLDKRVIFHLAVRFDARFLEKLIHCNKSHFCFNLDLLRLGVSRSLP